jgi:hypothetical protein
MSQRLVGRNASRQVGQVAAPSGLDEATAAGWCVCGSLCFAIVAVPIAMGGTHVLAIAALHAVMAVAICLGAVFLGLSFGAMAFALTCFAAAFLQLIPLPDSLLVAVAPVSAGAWKLALAGLPAAWGCISIEPAETAAAARRILLAIGTVATVACLATHPRYRRCLIAALSMSGTVIWTLGLLFPSKRNAFLFLGFIDMRGPLMDGRTPLEPPVATASFGFPEIVNVAGRQYAADAWTVGDLFGPYLITNHFAGALTLTVPFLAAAWLIMAGNHVPSWLRCAVAAALFLGAAATIGGMAKSRAGTASFVMAMLSFVALAAPAGVWRRSAMALWAAYVAAMACFLFALYGPLHQADRFFPPLIQPSLAGLLQDTRVMATHVAERMFLASPILGTGLGTYGDLYPRMVGDGVPHYFAHNDFAQLLAEAGLMGLLLAIVPAVALGRCAVHFYRRVDGVDRPLGAAAWAAVAGIAMHSCFDWNLHVPANALLACVAVGIALATGWSDAVTRPATKAIAISRPALAAVLVVTVVISSGYLMRDAASERTQRQLREAIAAARLHARDPKRTSPQDALVESIAAGKGMAAWDPHDAQLAVAIGQAKLHLSTFPMPIDDVDICLKTADVFFQTARRNCAICRGIAELPDADTSPKAP